MKTTNQQKERIKLLVSKREAAQMLSISLRTLDNLLRFNKELASRKIGSRRMIVFSSLLAFVRRDHVTRGESQ